MTKNKSVEKKHIINLKPTKKKDSSSKKKYRSYDKENLVERSEKKQLPKQDK